MLEKRLSSALDILRNYQPIAVYLFGSRAGDSPRSDSDVDIAILLPQGRRIPLSEKMDLAAKLEATLEQEVDLVILNEARLTLQFEIIQTGKLLYESSRDERTDAEDRIVRDYLDFEPLLEQSFKEIAEEARGGVPPV
ncbi:MAG: nucleotidyltransferase domain-containing protein [Bacillota bacterium]